MIICPDIFTPSIKEFKAAFEIKTGRLLAGEFPKNAERLVRQWAQKHRSRLLSNWEKSQSHEPLERIPGEE